MLRSQLRVLAGLPPTVRLLIAGSFVNRAGGFILPFLAIVLRRDFSLSASEVASLLAAFGAGSVVSIVGGGLFTDWLGRRRTLLLSLCGGGALAVAMGAAPGREAFFPLLVAFGFVSDLYRPASSAVLGDLLPSARRATGFAALRVAVNLGFALGMVLGGLLADLSWRLLFVGDGLTTLAFGALVYARVPETRPASPGSSAPGPGPWRDGVFVQLMAAAFCFSLMFFSIVTVLPLTVSMSAGYPARVYGLLLAVNGVLITFFEVSVVHQLRGRRRLRVAAVGMLCAGLGFGLTGLGLHWTWLLLTVVMWTAGEILTMPQMMAFVADWSPPQARGTYLSLYQATWSLAFVVNPLVALRLHERWGEGLWLAMPLLAAPAAAVVWRLDRRADRPELLRGRSEVLVA